MGWCGINGKGSKWHKKLFGKEPIWEESCHQHDCDYINGGLYLNEKMVLCYVTRLQSDIELFKAVASAGWKWWPMAVLYFIVVRLAFWKWNKL